MQAPLPPAGPARARAMRLGPLNVRATPKKGYLRVRVGCPPRWPAKVATPFCSGTLRMEGTRKPVAYSLRPGRQQVVRFRLTAKRLARLKKAKRAAAELLGAQPRRHRRDLDQGVADGPGRQAQEEAPALAQTGTASVACGWAEPTSAAIRTPLRPVCLAS